MNRRDFFGTLAAIVGYETFAQDDLEAQGRRRRRAVSYCYSGRPANLRGSPESMRVQRQIAEEDDLSRLTNANLNSFISQGRLVRLPRETNTYYLDEKLPNSRAVARPWAKLFLNRLSEQYHSRFGEKLKLNSASRTKEFQRGLQGRNSNATTPDRSSHPYGATFDIAYVMGKNDRMTRAQVNWMREVLSSLERADVIEATEECKEPVFHVMISKRYIPYVRRITGMSERQFERYYRRITGANLP